MLLLYLPRTALPWLSSEGFASSKSAVPVTKSRKASWPLHRPNLDLERILIAIVLRPRRPAHPKEPTSHSPVRIEHMQ
jgi:hypothetical protein